MHGAHKTREEWKYWVLGVMYSPGVIDVKGAQANPEFWDTSSYLIQGSVPSSKWSNQRPEEDFKQMDPLQVKVNSPFSN